MLYFSFTSFHCTNKANIRAICGAGIAGIEASLAGAAGSGAALYAACKEGKRLKQTEFLFEEAYTAFVTEKAEDVIEETCPNFSVECLLEFVQFLSDCPSGLNATCPKTPTKRACPGVNKCIAEFEVYRASNSGNAWFPTAQNPLDFVQLVENVWACFHYLSCFKSYSPRRLQEDPEDNEDAETLKSSAMRSLLLQKVFAHPDRWSALADGTADRWAPMREVVQSSRQMQLIDQLWASFGRNLTEHNSSHLRDLSESLMRADSVRPIFDQVSEEWQQDKQVNEDMCDNSAPLVDEMPSDPIP